jgi:hypothetical protein
MKTQKENLIKRAEQREEKEQKSGIGALGYPRKTPEIATTATAIIKTICEQEKMTPLIAKYALKMAVEIIDEETQHEAIL